MSLILDALRKMEQERKARRSGSIDIRPEVLSRRGNASPAGKNRLLRVAAALALLSAGIGAGLLLKGSRSPQAPQQTAAVATPEVRPDAVPPKKPDMPPPPPAATLPVKTVPAVAKPITVPPSPSLQAPAAQEPQQAAAGSPGTPLTISGIAWQDERHLRRAVVNGSLMGEGAEVAGARIVEIEETRVKFSQGGRTYYDQAMRSKIVAIPW